MHSRSFVHTMRLFWICIVICQMNHKASRHRIQDLCGLVAPFWGTKTLLLPIPPQQINNWLLRHIAGEWCVDGGRIGRRLWLVRDLHEYRGELHGNTFTVTGPLNLNKVPLVIGGVLQPWEHASCLCLSIRLAYRRFFWMLGGTLLFFVLFLGFATSFLQANASSPSVLWAIWVPVMTLWLTGWYIGIVMNIHWQIHLLINHLTVCAHDATNQGV